MRAIDLVALVALAATVVRHWLSLPEALARALSHALGCSLPQQAAQSMRSRLGRYEAREEETLSAVAVRFRTTVGSLLQMNPDISDDIALSRNRSSSLSAIAHMYTPPLSVASPHPLLHVPRVSECRSCHSLHWIQTVLWNRAHACVPASQPGVEGALRHV